MVDIMEFSTGESHVLLTLLPFRTSGSVFTVSEVTARSKLQAEVVPVAGLRRFELREDDFEYIVLTELWNRLRLCLSASLDLHLRHKCGV